MLASFEVRVRGAMSRDFKDGPTTTTTTTTDTTTNLRNTSLTHLRQQKPQPHI